MRQSTELTVSLLVNNLAAAGCAKEHGFGAWIECGGRRLLFDTGHGAQLEGNAQALGIDLSTTDILILSHGHYDHAGGIPVVLERAPDAQIYVHPGVTKPRYSIRGAVIKHIGMPAPARAAMESHLSGVHWTTQHQQLAPGIGITGPIPRMTGFEDTGGPFYLDPKGNEPDPIEDDQALWIRTKRGLVVIVGCCHSGLVNTLRYALQLSGEPHLHAVLGGFHLNEASEQRFASTAAELRRLGPELIVPCHCTGKIAVQRLKECFGERVVQGQAGAVFGVGEPAD